MHRALGGLPRFIVTPTIAKHRLFAWMRNPTLPDHQLIVIARDDDTIFGVLQSRFHEVWALRQGTSLEDRPRYTPSTTFETFPFPGGFTPDRLAPSYADDPRARAITDAAIALVAARYRWLNPPEMVDRVPEVVPGFPDRLVPKNAAAEQVLRGRTLTALYNTRGTPAGAWLDSLHRALDAAVADGYGWPHDLSEGDMLARLLALNHERLAAQ
jgi:type II restriction/modification system DNA methylase subunit YeeA